MIKVGIVGGTGYTGVELLRLLASHPEVEVRAITSRKEAGTKVADMAVSSVDSQRTIRWKTRCAFAAASVLCDGLKRS